MFKLITTLQLRAGVDLLKAYFEGEEVDEWEADGLISELSGLLEQSPDIPVDVLPKK